jgi:L-asparaginase II
MSVLDAGGGHVPVAVTRRSGLDESVHFGCVVGLGRSGAVELAAGDPKLTVYPRSANKPMQAAAMVDLGLDLPPERLALVCASHDGAPTHVAGVRAILAHVGLDEAALQNTPSLPLDQSAAEQVLRDGGGRTEVQMNCSGKHAGMVATCVVNGWSIDDYLEPEHPLQLGIADLIARLAGGVAHIGVDGCGAPAHALSLVGLAAAFRELAIEQGAVWKAMTGHPVMVGGTTRDVTVLMQHVPDLLAKDGAEGVFAAALPDGRAVAVKIADGASRAAAPVVLAALEQLGVDVHAAARRIVHPVLGHGHPVGEVRSVLELR